MSLAYIKDQMRHSSIQTTVDVYGHLVPGANKAEVDRLDEILRKNAPQTHPAKNGTSPLHPFPSSKEIKGGDSDVRNRAFRFFTLVDISDSNGGFLLFHDEGMMGSMMCGSGFHKENDYSTHTSDSSKDILDKRYAKGEIDKEEYEEKKKALTNPG